MRIALVTLRSAATKGLGWGSLPQPQILRPAAQNDTPVHGQCTNASLLRRQEGFILPWVMMVSLLRIFIAVPVALQA
ncbi:MAG: hypothetical protein Q8P22_13190, partial [Chloroflexota bacterium]|nr:hypothetical protein [Chloroflexota bacterium]